MTESGKKNGTILAFLRARLDEDEVVAKAATAGPWEVDDLTYAERIDAADGVSVVAGGRWGGEASVFNATEDAAHIARHDPARVLREVEAKRLAIHEWDKHEQVTAWALENDLSPTLPDERRQVMWRVLRILAAVYDRHPDYREEWKP